MTRLPQGEPDRARVGLARRAGGAVLRQNHWGNSPDLQPRDYQGELLRHRILQFNKNKQVSADLKMARSLVRLAEIQATLQVRLISFFKQNLCFCGIWTYWEYFQEQRILFLRQQVADLDRYKTFFFTLICHVKLRTKKLFKDFLKATFFNLRVDRPVTREMSRDRDTLTREGLQHRYNLFWSSVNLWAKLGGD